jgi:hypothetical protein
MTEETFKRPAILDDMDTEFNTAPIEESGGIMQGILNEQQGTTPEQQDRVAQEAPETKKELPSDYVLLNTSIQEQSRKTEEQNAALRREIADLRSTYTPQQQPQQQQQQQSNYQYDPEAPANLGHVNQLYQAYTGMNQVTQETHKDAAKIRGHLEFMRFKQDNPDFKMDPYDIDKTVDQFYKMGQPQQVTGANWRGHFENLYSQTRAVKLTDATKRIEQLEKELETMKKRPAPTTTTPVSPAVGKTTSRPSAIDTPLSEPNDDITKIKEFAQKGNFKGYGNKLKTKFGIAK